MTETIKNSSHLSCRGRLAVEVRAVRLVTLQTHPAEGSGAVPGTGVPQDAGQPQLLAVHVRPHEVVTRRRPEATAVTAA